MSKVRQLRLDEVTSIERLTNGWLVRWQGTARKGQTYVDDAALRSLVDDGFVSVGDR